MTKQWAVLEALEWTEQRLAKQGEENPRLAAQMLISFATGLSRIQLYAEFDKPLTECERAVLRESIQQRLDGKPLQYIIGNVGFRYLELKVCAPVLIPRPETESLVELVLQQIKQRDLSCARILDIGTGTGAIALSLLHELPQCCVVATDADDVAVELAQENASLLQLGGGPSQLEIIKDDLAASLVAASAHHHSFDVVVSNPPYIPTAEYENLPAEIIQFESRIALDGGADGLDVFRRIAIEALTLLKPGGLLAVELHEETLDQAAAHAQRLLYQDVKIHTDLTDRQRFLTAIRS